MRMLVVDVLEDMGCTVVEAGDGPTGLNALQAMPTIDLMITDVAFPMA